MNAKINILTLLLFSLSFSQEFSGQTTNAKPSKSVQDTLITGNITFSVAPVINTIEQNSRGLNNLQGFRIQIFFGPLDQAKQKRQDYISKGFVHQAYLEQNVPDFSLRVGDFLSEEDAKAELQKLKSFYPNAFLVKGHIEPPNLNYYINAIKDYEN